MDNVIDFIEFFQLIYMNTSIFFIFCGAIYMQDKLCQHATYLCH